MSGQLAVVNKVEDLIAVNPMKGSAFLENYASEKGDNSLVEILPKIEPFNMLKMMQYHDFSSPSILTELMSSEYILEMIKSFPLYWKKVDLENLRQLQEDMIDFMFHIVETQDNQERRDEIIFTIFSEEAGKFFVTMIFIAENHFDSHYKNMLSKIKERIVNVFPEFQKEIIGFQKANEWEYLINYYTETLISIAQGDTFDFSSSEEEKYSTI
jgi:hypothetical protein